MSCQDYQHKSGALWQSNNLVLSQSDVAKQANPTSRHKDCLPRVYIRVSITITITWNPVQEYFRWEVSYVSQNSWKNSQSATNISIVITIFVVILYISFGVRKIPIWPTFCLWLALHSNWDKKLSGWNFEYPYRSLVHPTPVESMVPIISSIVKTLWGRP